MKDMILKLAIPYCADTIRQIMLANNFVDPLQAYDYAEAQIYKSLNSRTENVLPYKQATDETRIIYEKRDWLNNFNANKPASITRYFISLDNIIENIQDQAQSITSAQQEATLLWHNIDESSILIPRANR